ncbi:MAG: cyanophycin synthetase, partial [Candidatus Neomarinimicrobiota bacterium]
EAEHLDCYQNLADIKDAFYKFTAKIPDNGQVIACTDEKEIPEFLVKINRPFTTYGLNSGEFQASNIQLSQNSSSFVVYHEKESLGSVQLNVPGRHNIKNALAAVALAFLFDIPFHTVQKALAAFQGVKRRFDIIYESQALMLIDDYAHHPSEITATLTAARKGWQRRIVAVFQPHLYSRTRHFYKEFAQSLQIADVIVILDIYAARETPSEGTSARLIFDAIKKTRNLDVYFTATKDDALKLLKEIKRNGDMIITLGAGDVNKILPKLME